ncbi:alpha/beta hydrolase [Sphingobium sp. DEHP117]|uniref:alpha/beta hydrolase n=1 Tax=Sphingobium sp. DEHP117 TaxID=2993436 RepID=UPI0027D5AF5D|nr:alpha/beta hydrolase fold domain-containing protein [Sphingobium sp. DEHP117]MDQ4421577.1 alpha/beta hydrolase [Sphingobium sp. DEHP117]
MNVENQPRGLHPVASAFRAILLDSDMAFENMSIGEARQAAKAFADAFPAPREEVGKVIDETIDTGEASLALRWYHPATPDPEVDGAVILHLHGGGWVMCDLESHDAICRALANASGATVLAATYRLAPEYPFPAAHNDAAAVLDWLASQADARRIDPNRIAVAGDSAGANLAASLALAGAVRAGPAIACQALFYPVTDLSGESPSYARCESGLQLTAPAMRWMRNLYVAGEADRADPRVSLLHAEGMSGMPPTFILTLEHDPLADEGKTLAERLSQEAGAVTHVHMSGHMHGFLNYGPAWAEGRAVIAMAAAFLKAWLHKND